MSTQILEYWDDQTSEKACKSISGSDNLVDPAMKSPLLTMEKEAHWSALATSTFASVKQ